MYPMRRFGVREVLQFTLPNVKKRRSEKSLRNASQVGIGYGPDHDGPTYSHFPRSNTSTIPLHDGLHVVVFIDPGDRACFQVRVNGHVGKVQANSQAANRGIEVGSVLVMIDS